MSEDENQAVATAGRGSEQWRRAVEEQRQATPDHQDMYALGGEVVDTVRALADLTRVLESQVKRYGRDRILRDDEGRDPQVRMIEAASYLEVLRGHLDEANRAANRFWSAIGHVAVEVEL